MVPVGRNAGRFGQGRTHVNLVITGFGRIERPLKLASTGELSSALIRFVSARMMGLEPTTSGVTGRCSNQLSYIPKPSGLDTPITLAPACSTVKTRDLLAGETGIRLIIRNPGLDFREDRGP